MKTINLKLSDELHAKLEDQCLEVNKTVEQYIRMVLDNNSRVRIPRARPGDDKRKRVNYTSDGAVIYKPKDKKDGL